MKIIPMLILISLPCLAQKDMQISMTNASISTCIRKPGTYRYKTRDSNIKDMQLTFTMSIATKEERAYPVQVAAYILVEKKDGSRKWKGIPRSDMSGFKWKSDQFNELNASEITGLHRISAGINDVDGKIIAWSIKATSQFDEGKYIKRFNPVFYEWKDKNAKNIKNPPMSGSALEDQP